MRLMPHDMDKQFDPSICEELIGYTFRDIVAMYKDYERMADFFLKNSGALSTSTNQPNSEEKFDE